MEPLDRLINTTLRLWDSHSSEKWYISLQHQQQLIRMEDPLPALACPFDFPSVEDLSQKKLLTTFDNLEKIRRDLVGKLSKKLPSPSILCKGTTWHRFQAMPAYRKRNNRPLDLEGDSPFPPLPIMHPAFYKLSNAIASPADSLQDPQDPDGHICEMAYNCAEILTCTMPSLINEHEEHVSKFKECLKVLFPETSMCKWKRSKRHTQAGRTSVDLSYEANGVPLIMIEVKLEFGTGGDPHIQLQAYYQTYLTDHPDVWPGGAPMFLVTLSGTSDLFAL
jgi:hypothetical protein